MYTVVYIKPSAGTLASGMFVGIYRSTGQIGGTAAHPGQAAKRRDPGSVARAAVKWLRSCEGGEFEGIEGEALLKK
jgi:hypothetical protein